MLGLAEKPILTVPILAGVKVDPFYTDNAALPGLPWDELLQVGALGPQKDHRAAAFMLTEPHFTQVSCSDRTQILVVNACG